MEEAEIAVSNGASTNAEDGEPAVTTGLSGRGKLISSNTSGSSDNFDLGDHSSDGEFAVNSKEKDCICHCCGCTGPAP